MAPTPNGLVMHSLPWGTYPSLRACRSSAYLAVTAIAVAMSLIARWSRGSGAGPSTPWAGATATRPSDTAAAQVTRVLRLRTVMAAAPRGAGTGYGCPRTTIAVRPVRRTRRASERGVPEARG